MVRLWSDREIGYFRQGLSDVEIIQLTGRSALAVIQKRRKITENTLGGDIEPVAPCMLMSQEEKEKRIHDLALKYGVKLMG